MRSPKKPIRSIRTSFKGKKKIYKTEKNEIKQKEVRSDSACC